VKESSPEYLQYLDKKKISIGAKITVIGKEFFDGSMVIQVEKDQFFISKQIAENLYVQTN
jgi:DtxR family Mn-dependent transcriptional regulator